MRSLMWNNILRNIGECGFMGFRSIHIGNMNYTGMNHAEKKEWTVSNKSLNLYIKKITIMTKLKQPPRRSQSTTLWHACIIKRCRHHIVSTIPKPRDPHFMGKFLTFHGQRWRRMWRYQYALKWGLRPGRKNGRCRCRTDDLKHERRTLYQLSQASILFTPKGLINNHTCRSKRTDSWGGVICEKRTLSGLFANRNH